ncbi:hypothetical protein BDZ91DRAFT_739195 [Kalaharituber pfeilii]|nr:hypothetical protein BDZ91DRAFT_739195 [Kalaharituber pfeilii]
MLLGDSGMHWDAVFAVFTAKKKTFSRFLFLRPYSCNYLLPQRSNTSADQLDKLIISYSSSHYSHLMSSSLSSPLSPLRIYTSCFLGFSFFAEFFFLRKILRPGVKFKGKETWFALCASGSGNRGWVLDFEADNRLLPCLSLQIGRRRLLGRRNGLNVEDLLVGRHRTSALGLSIFVSRMLYL